jgi:hypothetical protein
MYRGWEDNIKTGLREIRCRLDSSGSVWRPTKGCCEHNNEGSDNTVKVREFLDQLRDYKRFNRRYTMLFLSYTKTGGTVTLSCISVIFFMCEICCFHGGEDSDRRVLGCDALKMEASRSSETLVS